MRLDHLLSKEQHTSPAHTCAACLGGRREQLVPLKGAGVIVHLFSVIAVNSNTNELASRVGTLLGPETTRVVVSGSESSQSSIEFKPLPAGFHRWVVGVLRMVGVSGWCLRIV